MFPSNDFISSDNLLKVVSSWKIYFESGTNDDLIPDVGQRLNDPSSYTQSPSIETQFI